MESEGRVDVRGGVGDGLGLCFLGANGKLSNYSII